jgi:Nitrile hydratase beta subunit
VIAQRAGDAPFDAPWQARVFAMAVVAAERAGVDWDEFRDRLKAAVAADPERPYYETWMEALEAFAAELAPRPA